MFIFLRENNKQEIELNIKTICLFYGMMLSFCVLYAGCTISNFFLLNVPLIHVQYQGAVFLLCIIIHIFLHIILHTLKLSMELWILGNYG